MTFDDFSKMNRERSEAPNGFNHNLNDWTLSDWMTATMGELGEAANVTKKLNRYRDGITGNNQTEVELRAELQKEIADTFIYLDLTAQSAGFSLIEAVLRKFELTSKKIGYTPKAPV